MSRAADPAAPTRRTRLRRHPERGRFDRQAIHDILDEALIAHVGVQTDAGPMVLPMTYGRIGDRLYLHGALANSLLRDALAGPVCVTVTLLDGLVLARSWFHHSMNFRSVVAYGRALVVDDPEEKLAGMTALIEHMAPGRSRDAAGRTSPSCGPPSFCAWTSTRRRPRSAPEVRSTTTLTSGSWSGAGVVPLALTPSAPTPDPADAAALPPTYVTAHTGEGLVSRVLAPGPTGERPMVLVWVQEGRLERVVAPEERVRSAG